MISIKSFLIIMLANLGIFFSFVTLLTRLISIETLLTPKFKTKLIYSIFSIILAFGVMQVPLLTEAGNRLDLRSVAIYTAGIFGGPFPGIIVGSTVGLYRFILGGAGMEIGIATSILQGLITGLYSKYYLRNKLTQFNPLLIFIPIGISVLLHVIVVLLLAQSSGYLWPFRVWNYLFQILGTLVLTIIVQDALKIHHKTASLSKDVVIDKVTDTYNIKFLDSFLNENLSSSKKTGSIFSIIFLDLDYFKKINDDFGHQKGDEVLHKTAQTIKKSVKPSDVVGRYGGDEFMIILPNCDTTEAESVGQRIKDNIIKLQENEKLENYLSVSMGVATYPVHGKNQELLIKNADSALYKAKNSGRNKLIIA